MLREVDANVLVLGVDRGEGVKWCPVCSAPKSGAGPAKRACAFLKLARRCQRAANEAVGVLKGRGAPHADDCRRHGVE